MALSVFRSPRTPPVPLLHFVFNTRTFSATACGLKATGPLPTFEPTSNPELDTLINTIRNELFIPSHLLRRYRHLQLRKKNHYVLEEEPLSVDVSGQEIQLLPKGREVPIPVKTFNDCLDLMATPSDLSAIPGLLLGFSQANRPVRDRNLEKVARLINMNGRIDLLMDIARGAGENGFKFTRPTAREFMRGIKIQNSLPSKKSAVKALKNAQALLNFLGEPRMKKKPDERLKRDPVVVGTALAMFANTSKKFNDGKDYEGLTRQHIERLQNCWDAVEWEHDLKADDKSAVWRAKHAVLNYIPVLEGLILARDILAGSDFTPWIEAESAKLNNAVGGWMKFLEEKVGEQKPYGPHSYREAVERLEKELQAE